MVHEFITLPEASELSGVSVSGIWQAVERGAIFGGKAGVKRLVSRQSVEAYNPREYRSEVSGDMKDLRQRIEQIMNDIGLEHEGNNPLVQKLLISSRLGKYHDATGNYFQILLKPEEWDITRGFPKCTFRIEDYAKLTNDVVEQNIKDWIKEVQQGGFLRVRTTLDR